MDNNLSKSKKEAVLLRRQTDRRRKPSKKFRHTQYDPSEYSNNTFINDFLDTSSGVKKSTSTHLLDLNNSFDDSCLISKSTSKSADEIDFKNKSVGEKKLGNSYQSVKLRATATNRRSPSTQTTQFKTHSGILFILFFVFELIFCYCSLFHAI